MSELNFVVGGEVKTQWISVSLSPSPAYLHYPESRAEQEGTVTEEDDDAGFKETLCP